MRTPRPALLAGLFLVAGCGTFLDSDGPEARSGGFFPLEVGQRWSYRLTQAERDQTAFPERFTTAVLGDTVVGGRTYVLLTNYFVPGPSLPETLLVRAEGDRVFRYAGSGAGSSAHEEHLFYSFAEPDTLWQVPMRVGADEAYPYYGVLLSSAGGTATVRWGIFPYEGRGEGPWRETFTRGVGRSRIQSISQVYGELVWELERR